VATKKLQVYTCCVCGNTVEVLTPGGGTLVCCGVPMDLTVKRKPASGGLPDDSPERHVILGVHVTDRVTHAGQVQVALTEYGANIKTRLGIHDVHDKFCSPNGLMLIEFLGDDGRCDALIDRLSAIEGVETKRMVFDHPQP